MLSARLTEQKAAWKAYSIASKIKASHPIKCPYAEYMYAYYAPLEGILKKSSIKQSAVI